MKNAINTATQTVETTVELNNEEQKLLARMKERASKAISKMPPIMVIW